MEWNCDKCKREIISQKKENFCLECGWKDLVAKIEINPEIIRNFMEKYWYTSFVLENENSRRRESECINIFCQTQKTLSQSFNPRLETLYSSFYPSDNTRGGPWRDFSEHSAFLKRLFLFIKKENIKRIWSDWKKESKPNGEFYVIINSLIIEKKNAKELSEEKEPEEWEEY